MVRVALEGKEEGELARVAKNLEVYRLRCVIQDTTAALAIGEAMGADLLLWGDAVCPLWTGQGAPLVNIITTIEVHFYKRKDYPRALRLFRSASEKLRTDSRSRPSATSSACKAPCSRISSRVSPCSRPSSRASPRWLLARAGSPGGRQGQECAEGPVLPPTTQRPQRPLRAP